MADEADRTTDSWVIGGQKEEKPAYQDPGIGMEAVFLNDPELWENYESQDLYEADKRLRTWIAEMDKNKTWHNSRLKRRYTTGMLMKLVYGIEITCRPKKLNMYANLFSYYSSRIQKNGVIDKKYRKHRIYTISPARLKRPPYSLKLRVEWMAENGVAMSGHTLFNPKREVIGPGQARNPRTQANMDRRSELAKQRYRDRYKDRKH